MPVSARVRDDANFDELITVKKQLYGICKVGKFYRIYEWLQNYSTTTGGFTTKGKMIRRYDPEAGELEGKPAQFNTVAECESYALRWL